MSQVVQYNLTLVIQYAASESGVTNLPLKQTKTVVSDSIPANVTIKLTSQVPERYGYTFAGWESDDHQTFNAGDNATYAVGGGQQSSNVIEREVTMYATWAPKTYTVRYLKGSNGTGQNRTQTKTHGVTLTLLGAVFTRSGYTQVSWATSDGAQSGSYALNGKYTANNGITFYPVWRANKSTIDYLSQNVQIGASGVQYEMSLIRYGASYSHVVKFEYGNAPTVQYTESDISNNTLYFSIPSTWMKFVANSTTATATCTLETWGNGVLIGSDTKTFTIVVPSNIVPSVTASATIVNTNQTVANWGIGLQGFSQVKVDFVETLQEGTSFKKAQITGEGLSYSGTGRTATSAIINGYGTKTYTVVVTDSRGRTGTNTASVSVYRYFIPSVTSFKPVRSDSSGNADPLEGSYISITPAFTYAGCGGNNSLSVRKLEYKARSAQNWTTVTNSVSSGTTYTFGGGNVDLVLEYEVRITLTDALGKTSQITEIVSAVLGVSFGLNGRCGRFGGPVRYSDRFECDWDAQFDGYVDYVNSRATAELTSAGWYRVVEFTGFNNNQAKGASGWNIDFTIARNGGSTYAETHKISLLTYIDSAIFDDEISRSGALMVDKIRYAYKDEYAYIDIHYTGGGTNAITVYWDSYTGNNSLLKARLKTKNLTLVADAPYQETIMTTYSFNSNGAKLRRAVVSSLETANGVVGETVVSNLSSDKSISHNTNTEVLSLSLPAGTWIVVGKARFSANANGYRRCNISTTSAAASALMQVPAVSGAVTQLTVTKIMTVSVQTTIYLNAYQNSGSSLTMGAGSDGEINALSAVRIA